MAAEEKRSPIYDVEGRKEGRKEEKMSRGSLTESERGDIRVQM